MEWKNVSEVLNLRENLLINENGEMLNTTKNTMIYGGVNSRGYKHARMYPKDAKNEYDRKNYLIHRLVALTFLDNPEQKECVNHIDGDKLNNHYTNLEWVTRKENSIHAKTITTYRKLKSLTKDNIITIIYDYLNSDKTQHDISMEWNLSRESVRTVINKKSEKILSDDEYKMIRHKYRETAII